MRIKKIIIIIIICIESEWEKRQILRISVQVFLFESLFLTMVFIQLHLADKVLFSSNDRIKEWIKIV